MLIGFYNNANYVLNGFLFGKATSWNGVESGCFSGKLVRSAVVKDKPSICCKKFWWQHLSIKQFDAKH